jgi:uncharacterized protein (DUF305 family)
VHHGGVPLRLRRPAALLVTASLALALTACTSEDADPTATQAALPRNVVQPGAPGEDSVRLDPTAMPSVVLPQHTEADVAFVQGMIGHHAQAIVMTALVPDRSEHPDLELFVQRMDISQVAEIEQMQEWLRVRGEDVPAWDPVFGAQGGHADGSSLHGDDLMPGMLTDEQVEELAAAEGTEFDRLFLEYMTQHHDGARRMVQELFEAGGGEEIEVFQLANHIESDQSIEMDRMAAMYAELPAR